MAGLAETTARLRRSRQGGARPSGIMHGVEDFGSNPGNLRLLAYRPASAPPLAPLVVVLHGCTQAAEAFAAQAGWLTLAEREGFVVIAPEQSSANNPNRCFNWFEPADTRRDGGEAASIARMVAYAVEHLSVDPARVFVTGLSAGGAMAAVMLGAYPDLFRAGAVVAGLPFGVARDMAGAFAAMRMGSGLSGDTLDALAPAGPDGRRPRLAIWHGDADHVVSSKNALDLTHQWGAGAHAADVETLQGRTRTRWRDPQTAEVVLELNMVHGLGHGTPLSATGDAGLGSPAPFMLEAGISSTLEIAAFFGLSDPPSSVVPLTATATPAPPPPAETHTPLGDQVMAAIGSHAPARVRDVVARALRSAGL